MRGAPTPVAVTGVPALAAACRNAAIATKLDGTRRILATTASNIYELVSGSWTSRASGYALGDDDRWDLAQFGDSTLAATPSEPIQISSSTTFADISGAPQARIIEVAKDFVLAFNTNAGSDVWACSAILDATDWTVSLTTQSNTGRLVSTPGAITAAKAFGDQVVVYKERSMYLGYYVGGDATWEFRPIPGDVGCVGVDAVTDLGGLGQISVGRSDIIMFDGTRQMSIAEGSVRQWFYDNCSQAYLYKTILLHDKQNNVVWMFYPSRQSTVCDEAMVYHLGKKQWGTCTTTVEAALNYVSPGITIDSLSITFDQLPNVSFDSQYWQAGGRIMTVFTSAHQLSTMTGITGSSSITLFDVVDDQVVSRLRRLRMAYQQEPTSATIMGVTRDRRGGLLVDAGAGTYANGKFDIRQSARGHRLTINAVGSWVSAAVDFDFQNAGTR